MSFTSINGLFALVIFFVFIVRDIVNFVKDRIYSDEKKIQQLKKKKMMQYYFRIAFFMILVSINIIWFFQNQDIIQRLINVIAILLSLGVIIFGIKKSEIF